MVLDRLAHRMGRRQPWPPRRRRSAHGRARASRPVATRVPQCVGLRDPGAATHLTVGALLEDCSTLTANVHSSTRPLASRHDRAYGARDERYRVFVMKTLLGSCV